MKYYMINVQQRQVGQIRQFAQMALRFKPELAEEAVLKVLEEDDLSDEQLDAGVGMVVYADEATYKLARQFGGPAAVEVDEIPANAQDLFDLL